MRRTVILALCLGAAIRGSVPAKPGSPPAEESDAPLELPSGRRLEVHEDAVEPPRPDPGAVDTLSRARRAAAEGDWTRACELLQEVIDAPRTDVALEEDGRPVALRETCEREIAGWPEAGRAAYRDRFAAVAATSIERAERTVDPSRLARIGVRFGALPEGTTAFRAAARLYADRGMSDMAAACRRAAGETRLALPDGTAQPLPDLPAGNRLESRWRLPLDRPLRIIDTGDLATARDPELPSEAPFFQPPVEVLAAQGRIWFRDGSALLGVDPETGEVARRIPLDEAPPAAARPGIPGLDDEEFTSLLEFIGGWATLEHRRVRTDGRALVLACRSGPERVLRYPNRMNGTPVVTPLGRVTSVDPASGDVRWTFTIDEGFLAGDPLPAGDRIFVPIALHREPFEIRIRALDRLDGSPLWDAQLCVDAQKIPFVALTLHEGSLYAETAYGYTACLSPLDGRPRWIAYHKPHAFVRRQALPAFLKDRGDVSLPAPILWSPRPPAAAGGGIVSAAPCASVLRLLDAEDGSVRWGIREDSFAARYVLGSDRASLWTVSDKIRCRNPADGTLRWESEPIPTPFGIGTVGERLLYVPTVEGILAIDRESGAIARSLSLPDGAHAGNVTILPEGTLVVANHAAVTAYAVRE